MKTIALIALLLLSVVSVTAQNRSGTYEYSKIGEYKTEYWGQIEIREIIRKKRKVLQFKISAGAYNKNQIAAGCVGELEGIAQWTAPNVAEYQEPYKQDKDYPRDEFCHLTFFFTGNRLVVRQTSCNYYHGANCGFEGTFIKKNSRSTKKNS